jgi:P-type Ca2+ transporter type 2C
MTEAKRKEFLDLIDQMAGRALRTLAIAHKDYKDLNAIPANYRTDPPDSSDLILDAIVGIIDPLRSDVKDAVKTAQGAGVMVRMVTGDNIITARAIAQQCGILTGTGETLTKEMYEQVRGCEDEAKYYVERSDELRRRVYSMSTRCSQLRHEFLTL